MAGLLRPEAGTVRVAERDLTGDTAAAARFIGLMPDPLGVYTDVSCREYLQFFAMVHWAGGSGLPDATGRAADVLGWGRGWMRKWNRCPPAGSGGWPWDGCCCWMRRCCCWTNRPPDST
jgi:hypothetical protein